MASTPLESLGHRGVLQSPLQSPPERRAATASQRASQIARHILGSPGTWPHALQPRTGCRVCMERGQWGRSGHRSSSQLCFIKGPAQTIPGPWPEGGGRGMMAAAPHLYSHRAPAPRCAWESLCTCLLTPGGEDLHGGECVSGEGWGPERGDSGPHMAASWPSTILNCCVLLARSLTRSTMSLEAEGDG